MTRSTPLAALAAALFLAAAVTPAVPDDSSLSAELERLSKQMELRSLIRQLSTEALKAARIEALLALRKTTLWRRYKSARNEREADSADLAGELATLLEQFELEIFRQRMKKDLNAILKRPVTEDDINRLYADAAARIHDWSPIR